jgi:hypothetical protein
MCPVFLRGANDRWPGIVRLKCAEVLGRVQLSFLSGQQMTNVDAALEQQVFDLAQRQRIADVHHHREANNLGRAVETARGVLYLQRLRLARDRLKPI